MVRHSIYRLKFNWRKWFEYAGSFPVHVDIELAGKCQLACIMCPYGDGSFDKSKQGMMDTKIAIEAIQQAAKGGAKSIKFNFRGEPALHKNLEYFVYVAKQLGIVETSINTNLTAFTHKRLYDLCVNGLDLMIISIDGATKNTYESIRVNGNWEKLISNLNYISSFHRINRPKIRIQVVKQLLNSYEINTRMFRYEFASKSDELIYQNLRQDNKGERRRCPQPWQRLIVGWDGKVFACCSNWNNEFPVGQFPEDSLYQIWNNGLRLQVLRDHARNFHDNPCKDCTVGASYK